VREQPEKLAEVKVILKLLVDPESELDGRIHKWDFATLLELEGESDLVNIEVVWGTEFDTPDGIEGIRNQWGVGREQVDGE